MKISLFVAFFLFALKINLTAETFADSSITFTYPSDWKLVYKNDTDIVFEAGKSITFSIEHVSGYDGDEVKLGEDKKAFYERRDEHVTIENSDLGEVFAVKMTREFVSHTNIEQYISYLYRDRKSYNEDPVMVSSITYGGSSSDFATIEPQCINVYKSIKFKTRTSGKLGKYSFEYPVGCAVKEFTEHSQYVTTNAPVVKNNGASLMGFFIGETPPEDKANIDTAVYLKRKSLRNDGYLGVVIRDTTVGGKPGKVIHYKSRDGVNKRLIYVGLKGSLYWFSFDPPKEAENHSFYKAADLIMRSFRFVD